MLTIEFSVPVSDIISANGREHHMKVAGKTKRIREQASWFALAEKRKEGCTTGPLMQRANVTVSVGFQPLKRTRDADNMFPTIKAAIDGCIDAGVLPDDSDKHRASTTYLTYERSEPGVVWLRLEFSDAS